LAGYRQDRCAPTDDAFTAITSGFAHPLRLGLGVHRVARSTGVSKDLVLAQRAAPVVAAAAVGEPERPIVVEYRGVGLRSVRLFDCLQYDGSSWQVIAQDGATLALKNLATGRIRKVAIAELLGDDSYLPDSPDRLPKLNAAAILETLDPETRRRAEFLHCGRRSADGSAERPHQSERNAGLDRQPVRGAPRNPATRWHGATETAGTLDRGTDSGEGREV
jgi:hypothetical protein